MRLDDDEGVEFYLTGFDKFGSVVENPTMKLIQKVKDGGLSQVQESSPAKVVFAEVWEVSAEFTDEAIRKLHASLDGDGPKTRVFLHMGVDSGSRCFRLEQTGYNLANFSFPDERGWAPQMEPIIPENGSVRHTLVTSVPTALVSSRLSSRGFNVRTSNDAGRFICNYTLYKSLHHAKQSGALVFFLHVPSEGQVPLDRQLIFLGELVRELALALSGNLQMIPKPSSRTVAVGADTTA